MDSSYVVLATKVNNAVKLSIEDYVSGFNKAHKKGSGADRIGRVSVSTEKSSQRNYPYGAFAAAVLGFTDGEGVGTYGLEKSYQSTLAGVDGRTITRRNAVGNAIADQNATTFAAKDGSNLVLSLDVNVQEIVERYLTEAVAANNVENRGCAIVMNVKTGAILAMASKPDFDPNTPLDYSANLAYLQEQVAAEPELYTIYLRDENDSKKFKLDENGNKIKSNCGGFKVNSKKFKDWIAKFDKDHNLGMEECYNKGMSKDEFFRSLAVNRFEDLFKGATCTIETQELSKAENSETFSLRFPQFIMLRDDK
jgi:stage V sporulation protein D (sporulation-specific penicillin-binding protein)